MDAHLALITAQQNGFFFRRQALEAGYSEKEFAALVRSEQWVRLRRGAYAPRELVDQLDAAGRHVLTARAVVAAMAEPVLTGYSALAVLGVPIWGVDLGVVHIHRGAEGTSRREAGVAHHIGPLSDEDIVEHAGLLIARGPRSAVDAARTVGFEPGVVLADGVLRLLGVDKAELQQILEEQRDAPGSILASRVLRFSDAGAQTVGESRTRLLMARIGIAPSHLQYRVLRDDGWLVGVTDLYVEAIRTVVEFDGRLKYGRALYERGDAETPTSLDEVLWAEKRREDAIRDVGHEMVRIVWSELDGQDARVQQRFRRAADRAARYRRSG